VIAVQKVKDEEEALPGQRIQLRTHRFGVDSRLKRGAADRKVWKLAWCCENNSNHWRLAEAPWTGVKNTGPGSHRAHMRYSRVTAATLLVDKNRLPDLVATWSHPFDLAARIARCTVGRLFGPPMCLFGSQKKRQAIVAFVNAKNLPP